MEQKKIGESDLIINSDGSVYHLHIRPDQMAHKVILVGDPGRVDMVKRHFDSVLVETANREFVSAIGAIMGYRVMVLSTGIGADNIDIVMNELDALVNIDFDTRLPKKEHTTLHIVRLGTCGSLQSDLDVGDVVVTDKAIGLDGLLNYYAGRDEVCDLALEEHFCQHMQWNERLARPYAVAAPPWLADALTKPGFCHGLTVTAPGFYGPQGRQVRLALADPQVNERLRSFNDGFLRIVNYEMESSAIYGMAKLLGHNAATVCLVVADRYGNSTSRRKSTDTATAMDDLARTVAYNMVPLC